MASRIGDQPRERERVEEELRLEPMLEDREFEALYGTRAWLRDRVRLAPVFAGVFWAFAVQIVLLSLGLWVGAITATPTEGGGIPTGLATGLGIWTAISALIALFVGGWFAAHMAGIAGRLDAVLNGITVWGLSIFLGVILSGFTGLLGVGSLLGFRFTPGASGDVLSALNLAALPNIPPDQVQAILSFTASAAGWFLLGAIVSAAAAALGGYVGARRRIVTVAPPRR